MKNKLCIFFLCFIVSGFSQSEKESKIYSLSELYDIRQEINPDFAFLTTPLQRTIFADLKDTEHFVFYYTDYHLDVYDKAEGYWQVFTLPNGFTPISKVLDTYDYEDHFAILGKSASRTAPKEITMQVTENEILFGSTNTKKSDTWTIVNVFDKKLHIVYSLSKSEYESYTKDKQRLDFENEKFSWYLDKKYPYLITKEDKNTGAKSHHSFTIKKQNHCTALHQYNDKVFALSENLIRIFDAEKNEKLLNSANALYCNGLTNLTFGNEIIATYGNMVQLLDPFDYHETSRIELSHKADHILHHKHHFYYSEDRNFYIYDEKTDSTLLKASFTFRVNKLSFTAPHVFIYTEAGYSKLNIESGEIVHYFDNSTGYYESEGYHRGLSILGEMGKHILAYTKYYDRNEERFIINVFKVSKATDSITELHMEDKIKRGLEDPLSTQIIDNRLVIASAQQFNIYKITNAETFSLDHEMSWQFDTENTEAIPNAFKWESDYPVGGDVLAITMNQDQVWISTYRGIFCYDMDIEKWNSHILPSSMVQSRGEIIITDEAIYSHGSTNATQPGPSWSRIGRKGHKIKYFYGSNAKTHINSHKKNSEEIISASSMGMYIYNYKTNHIRVIPTPKPIRQVCFYEQGYLAANAIEIYKISKDGEAQPIHTFRKTLSRTDYYKTPGQMERNGNTLWFASRHNFEDKFLTRLQLNSGHETRYLMFNEVVKIIPGDSITWIIGSTSLYKYDEKKETMLLFSIMTDSNNRFVSNQYNDAILYKDKLLVTSNKAIFAINLETMKISEHKGLIYKNYPPENIRHYDHKFFLASAVGIYQYDEHVFMNEFFPAVNLKSNEKEIWTAILPYNIRDTVKLKARNQKNKLIFTLHKSLKEKTFEKLRPRINLSANLGSDEIKINRMAYSSDEHENIFYIILSDQSFQGSSQELKIYFTDADGSRILARKWIVEK